MRVSAAVHFDMRLSIYLLYIRKWKCTRASANRRIYLYR